MKFYLTSIFAFICLSLNAQESVIVYENAVNEGKEYLLMESASLDNSFSQVQNTQTEIVSGNASCMFIAEDAKIYGKENLFVEQKNASNPTKNANKIKKKAPELAPEPELAENKIDEQKPVSKLLAFPISPSSCLYAQGGNESAVILQQRPGRQQLVDKIHSVNTYQPDSQLDISLNLPKQRQRLSITATQCGVLSSFGSQSPPFFN